MSIKSNLQPDDVLGYGELLRGAAAEYKPKLLAATDPHDPTARIASTEAAAIAYSKKRALAKAAMDEAERLNGEAEDAKDEYYGSLSNWTDLMASTLGKTSPEGTRVLKIRADLRPYHAKKSTPATPPTS